MATTYAVINDVHQAGAGSWASTQGVRGRMSKTLA